MRNITKNYLKALMLLALVVTPLSLLGNSQYFLSEELSLLDNRRVDSFIEKFPGLKDQFTVQYKEINDLYANSKNNLEKIAKLNYYSGHLALYFYYKLPNYIEAQIVNSFSQVMKARNDYINLLNFLIIHLTAMSNSGDDPQFINSYAEKRSKDLQTIKENFLRSYEAFKTYENIPLPRSK